MAGALRACTAVLVNRTSAAPQEQLCIIHQPGSAPPPLSLNSFSAGSCCSCQAPARAPAALGREPGMGQSDPAGEYTALEGPGMPESGFLHRPCAPLGEKAQAPLSLNVWLLSQQCVALWSAGSLRGGRWQRCLQGAPAPHGPREGLSPECPTVACSHQDRAGAGDLWSF